MESRKIQARDTKIGDTIYPIGRNTKIPAKIKIRELNRQEENMIIVTEMDQRVPVLYSHEFLIEATPDEIIAGQAKEIRALTWRMENTLHELEEGSMKASEIAPKEDGDYGAFFLTTQEDLAQALKIATAMNKNYDELRKTGISCEEDLYAETAPDLRVMAPERSTDPEGRNGYAHQECQEFVNGRWEGFVITIKSESGYLKRLKEFRTAQ